MNRRGFIKGLLLTSAAMLTGAELLAEAKAGKLLPVCDLPKECREIIGTSTGCYQLTAGGYLLFGGQSIFPGKALHLRRK